MHMCIFQLYYFLFIITIVQVASRVLYYSYRERIRMATKNRTIYLYHHRKNKIYFRIFFAIFYKSLLCIYIYCYTKWLCTIKLIQLSYIIA